MTTKYGHMYACIRVCRVLCGAQELLNVLVPKVWRTVYTSLHSTPRYSTVRMPDVLVRVKWEMMDGIPPCFSILMVDF